jgi:hypothetical protein
MPRGTVPTPDYQLNDLVGALWIKRGRMLIEEQKLRAEPCRHQQRERLPLTSREEPIGFLRRCSDLHNHSNFRCAGKPKINFTSR